MLCRWLEKLSLDCTSMGPHSPSCPAPLHRQMFPKLSFPLLFRNLTWKYSCPFLSKLCPYYWGNPSYLILLRAPPFLLCSSCISSQVSITRSAYPETVPFRLTRMLINAMEGGGIEGRKGGRKEEGKIYEAAIVLPLALDPFLRMSSTARGRWCLSTSPTLSWLFVVASPSLFRNPGVHFPSASSLTLPPTHFLLPLPPSHGLPRELPSHVRERARSPEE